MRRAAYAGVALAALLLVSSTGGFTSVNADRPLGIAVADDDEAFLGIETTEPTLANGRHDAVALATVTNRLPGPLTDVDVRLTGATGGQPPKLLPQGNPDVTVPATLDVTEDGTVTADVGCSAAGGGAHTVTWDLHLEASGDGVTVELTRPVTVTCTGEPADAPATETAD